MNKKLTVGLTQGTLGKLHPPYELLVKHKSHVGHIQTIVNILSSELEVGQHEVASSIFHSARSEDNPKKRIESLTEALIELATKAIINNHLYSDIPPKELPEKLKVITQRWSEDVITKIRTLPELRRKKLMSDRKCRLKNYVTKCANCDATGSDLVKDFQKLSVKCKKCGWTRTFDGSGKRTIPKKKKAKKVKPKAKPKKAEKKKIESVTTDPTKEEIKANQK